MSPLNFMELCRLCLVKDRVQIPIFEGEGDIRQIFLKIAACLPVKVKKDDKLPKKICDDCMYKVEMLYQFWNTTANAEKQLLEWLGEAQAQEDKKTASEPHVKQESLEQDNCSELAKSLSRVEAVLAETREVESDNDNFASGKAETDSDDEPLSSLEPTTFVNVGLDGSGTNESQSQGEFLAPGAPSTSKTTNATNSQNATSGSENDEKLDNTNSNTENSVKEESTEMYLKNIKLRCEFCHKDFPKRYDLISHRARVHKEQNEKPRVPCPHCSKSFPRNYLRIHMKGHVGAKKKCPHCNYTTPYSKSLKFHISKIHTKEFDYNCDMCGRGFMEKYALKEHIKKEHGEGISCETCQRTFHSEYYLKIHQETHKPDYEMRNYVCDLCNKRFLSRKMLRQHLLKHSGSTKVYKCTYCNKELSSNASLKAHTNIHTGLRPYVCEICGNGFARRNYLVVHMRTHTREKPYVCQECGAAFAQKTSLTFHMRQLRSHLNQNTGAPLDFICAFCDKGFLTDQILQEHMAKLHGEGAPRIVCDICNKTFANRKNLRVHKQSHELTYEERKHQCDVCGKKFLTKSNLFRHIRAHLQTGQFECSYCKKCLSSLSTLKDHEKIHTGEKPFICEVCGKSFSRKKYLVTHSNTHANEKCYSCKECGSSFSQRGALTRHQRSTHIRRDPVRIMENVRKPKKKALKFAPLPSKMYNLEYDKK